MKNYVSKFSVVAFLSFSFFACEKEPEVVIKNDSHVVNQIPQYAVGGGYLFEEKGYTWNEGILYCTIPGTGCEVGQTFYFSAGFDSVHISKLQLLKLISLGKQNLNAYFSANDLSYEFPSLYEENMSQLIANSQVLLTFEFPYFKVTDSNGTLTKIYNYENIIYDEEILMAVSGGEDNEPTRLVKFPSPGSTAIWDCLTPGSNCVVKKNLSFDVHWLAKNPKYLFYYDNTANFANSSITLDEASNKILIQTTSSDVYGIEL